FGSHELIMGRRHSRHLLRGIETVATLATLTPFPDLLAPVPCSVRCERRWPGRPPGSFAPGEKRRAPRPKTRGPRTTGLPVTPRSCPTPRPRPTRPPPRRRRP